VQTSDWLKVAQLLASWPRSEDSSLSAELGHVSAVSRPVKTGFCLTSLGLSDRGQVASLCLQYFSLYCGDKITPVVLDSRQAKPPSKKPGAQYVSCH
jgi:hypothetical protein